MKTDKYYQCSEPLETKAKGNKWIIRGWASTIEEDRDHDVIVPIAFQESLSQYLGKSGGMLLWMHDRMNPIGKVTKAEIREEEGVFIEAEISKSKGDIWQMTQDTPLNFSVGFSSAKGKPREVGGMYITYLEWIETSIVSIPSNRGAFLEVAKGLDLVNKGYSLEVKSKECVGKCGSNKGL